MTVQSDPDRRALLLCVEKYDPKTLSKSPRIRGKAFAELARTRDDARRMHEEVEKLGFVAEHLSDMCAQGISRKVAKFVQQAVKHQAKIASEPPHVRLDRNQVLNSSLPPICALKSVHAWRPFLLVPCSAPANGMCISCTLCKRTAKATMKAAETITKHVVHRTMLALGGAKVLKGNRLSPVSPPYNPSRHIR